MSAKAVSYLRVSGKGQIAGDGFPRQREKIASYAKANGLNVEDEYRDGGVSGTNELADRPGLAALIDRIESNGVRVVLIENASRLARDLMVQEVILHQFRKLGVRVIECDGGNDLTVAGDDNPTAKLIRQILGAVAEFEKNVLVLKLRASRDRIRRRDGRCEGRKPYGFHPNESIVLEKIKKLRRKPRGGDRLSLAGVAEQLNRDGFRNRAGKPWNRAHVWKVMQGAGIL